jgi:hypothetical protein
MKLDPSVSKVKAWAANPKVVRAPRMANLPNFTPKKFDSYAEFNAWKTELQREIIRNGGAKWIH